MVEPEHDILYLNLKCSSSQWVKWSELDNTAYCPQKITASSPLKAMVVGKRIMCVFFCACRSVGLFSGANLLLILGSVEFLQGFPVRFFSLLSSRSRLKKFADAPFACYVCLFGWICMKNFCWIGKPLENWPTGREERENQRCYQMSNQRFTFVLPATCQAKYPTTPTQIPWVFGPKDCLGRCKMAMFPCFWKPWIYFTQSVSLDVSRCLIKRAFVVWNSIMPHLGLLYP